MEKLTRRSFFKLAGGGVAAAIVAPYAIAETITRVPVELGWTWFIDKKKVEPTLADLVSKTLRENKNKIIDSMFEKNALYAKLHDGKKILIEVERISPEDQNQRMKVRLQQRLDDKLKTIIDRRPEKGGRLYNIDNTIKSMEDTYYTGYENLEKKYVP